MNYLVFHFIKGRGLHMRPRKDNYIKMIYLKKFPGFHLTLNPSDDTKIQGMW